MPSIFSWRCSYYQNTTRKWVNGKLSLREFDLLFGTDDTTVKDNTIKIRITFDDICGLKKATSTLIYKCLVLNTKTDALWFGSFSNLEDVYKTVEYFWREKLYTSVSSTSLTNQKSNELLNIVHGTQDTLMEASKSLHAQGKQINRAAVTMNLIHQDLSVAERISEDLDSYFCSWRVRSPPVGGNVDNHLIERNDIVMADRIEYQILYARCAQESHKSGLLTLNNLAIDILDEKNVSLFSSQITQLSNIEVNSPWDINITKRGIGKEDIHWHLISTKMPEIIKSLQKVYNFELSFNDIPEDDISDDDEEENFDRIGGEEETTNYNRDSLLSNSNRALQQSRQASVQTQLTSEESGELSKVLNNIKSMAVNIGVEQEAQLKQLDNLSESVERANDRIRSTDRKINKLL